MPHAICSVPACSEPARKRGLCTPHHREAGGDLEDRLFRANSAALSSIFWGRVTFDEDHWLWTGTLARGHGQFHHPATGTTPAHRFSWWLANGKIPNGMQIDHTCDVAHCLKPSHLRVVTPRQNTENWKNMLSTNTSGCRGVHWRKDSNRWQVTIRVDGLTRHFGYFRDLDEAREVARQARNELLSHNDRDRLQPS